VEPRLRPVLDRQDAHPIEPGRPHVHRNARVPPLPEGAGRENRARRRDLLPARAGVHRSADHRRRDRDPQGSALPVLPGAGWAARARAGHARAGRFRRRTFRARHQHVHGGSSATRSRLRVTQRPGGAGRRALARISGTAHGRELPESPVGSGEYLASGRVFHGRRARRSAAVPAAWIRPRVRAPWSRS